MNKKKKELAAIFKRPPLKFEQPPEVLSVENLKHLRMKSLQPGDLMEGQGIYVGKWVYKKLGLIFNLFAAPQDLTDEMGKKTVFTFRDASQRVSELKQWHGHDGVFFDNEQALLNTLEEGNYKGEWFIPTYEMLAGKDADGNKTSPDNLYTHRDKRAFKGTFTTSRVSNDSGYSECYWSSTDVQGRPSNRYVLDFSEGYEDFFIKINIAFSCRPVRLVPVQGL